jgi:acetyl-CoA carboxylase biotin carboxyl carrier protein
MDWDDADVRAILQLVDAAGFDELEIETDRFTLSLRRSATGAAWTREARALGAAREIAIAERSSAAPADGVARAAAAQDAAAAQGAAAAQDAAEARFTAVRTPLPGTFYRSPKPGAPPFVDIGTPVVPDTVVAIVETMKLMNSIYAGVAGRIVSVELDDGTFAAQNAALLLIEPGGTAPSGAADGS